MRKTIPLLLLSALLIGCAGQTPKPIVSVAKSSCDLANEIGPAIVSARETIIETWDVKMPDGAPIWSEESKAALKKINNRLPDLKRAADTACAIANGASGGGVDWTGSVNLILQMAGEFAQFYLTR